VCVCVCSFFVDFLKFHPPYFRWAFEEESSSSSPILMDICWNPNL
jgi:hypothetical protein